MKIDVICTGGTIGSSLSNGYIKNSSENNQKLLSNISNIDFNIIEPYNILSENLSAKQINLLVKTIKNSLNSDCDGIIVTHGTDTLQYSAVAVQLLIGNIDKAIVFVSANYPLDDARSNGYANLQSALDYIKSENKGVVISYKNTDRKQADIFIPTTVLSHNEMLDNIVSVPNDVKFPTYDIELCANPQILVIDCHPADFYDYDLSKYRTILIKPYHSGTLNVENEYFKIFCNNANSRNIPIYVSGCRNNDLYITSSEFSSLGIQVLIDISFPTAYMKLWIENSLKNK